MSKNLNKPQESPTDDEIDDYLVLAHGLRDAWISRETREKVRQEVQAGRLKLSTTRLDSERRVR
jgi:hypothetical protein